MTLPEPSIPDSVDGWTYELVLSLLQHDFFEGERFDFKEVIDSRDASHTSSIVNAVAAFANTAGGFLVFGVGDRQKYPNPVRRIRGLEPSGENIKHFGDKIQERIFPAPHYVAKNPPISIPNSTRVLEVVHVTPSQKGVHAVEYRKVAKAFLFYKRTPSGNQPMNYQEIRDRFADIEAARRKLRLLAVELDQMVRRFKQFQSTRNDQEGIAMFTLDEQTIKGVISDTWSILYDHPDIVSSIYGMLDNVNVMNNEINSYSQTGSLKLTGQKGLTADHNRFSADRADEAVPLAREVLQELSARFDLEWPVPFPEQKEP